LGKDVGRAEKSSAAYGCRTKAPLMRLRRHQQQDARLRLGYGMRTYRRACSAQ